MSSLRARLPTRNRNLLESLMAQPLSGARLLVNPSAAQPAPPVEDSAGNDLFSAFLRQQQETQEAKAAAARPPTVGSVLGSLVVLLTLEADVLAQQPAGTFGHGLTPQGAAAKWLQAHMTWATALLLRLAGPLNHSAVGLEAALDNVRRAHNPSIVVQLNLAKGPFSNITVEDAVLAGQAAATAAKPPPEDARSARPFAERRPSSFGERRPSSGALGRSEPRAPCLKYNVEGLCGVASCRLAHVCSTCFGRHPAKACPRGQGSHTPGSGSSGGAPGAGNGGPTGGAHAVAPVK